MTPKQKEFTRAYLDCLLWQATDPDTGAPLDRDYGLEDIPYSAIKEIIQDCKGFHEANYEMLIGAPCITERAGHDFCLTRNRHGAGFWDDPEFYGEEYATALTEAAHAYGSQTLWPDGSGKLFLGS